MSPGKHKTRLARFLQCLLLSLVLSFPSHSLVADAFSDRRAYVGLKLFRTLLAADLDAPGKSGNTIYFVYATDQALAEQHAKQYADNAPKAEDISLETIPLERLISQKTQAGGVFVSQKLNGLELDTLVNYAKRQHVITFSPYEGDVEAGVLGGLAVEATIKPYINVNTLSLSAVNIKSFYLKVAKLYE
ncbi:hypothetical protein [Gilvimarinus algae]|uniref:YfiR family protein n=1 Tax=Gilvimarinus algae TaxID=3058037 RepID=A0ABT8TAA0_9GAMM|nr:hypothetical protein [Gilvimarinus sp. SDUM040014]MDO3380928.1 hypothetical protein [Gilvimarinus sp. SDUM040014]